MSHVFATRSAVLLQGRRRQSAGRNGRDPLLPYLRRGYPDSEASRAVTLSMAVTQDCKFTPPSKPHDAIRGLILRCTNLSRLLMAWRLWYIRYLGTLPYGRVLIVLASPTNILHTRNSSYMLIPTHYMISYMNPTKLTSIASPWGPLTSFSIRIS